MKDTQKQDKTQRVNKYLTIQEHIRLRPGMYMGATDTRGLVHMLSGTFVEFITHQSARSFHLYLHQPYKIQLDVEGDLSHFSPKRFESIDLDRFELPVLCATSTHFQIEGLNSSDQSLFCQRFYQGILQDETWSDTQRALCKIKITFDLDSEIWGDSFRIHTDFLLQAIRELAFLNSQQSFTISQVQAERTLCSHFHYPDGLADFLVGEDYRNLGRFFFTLAEKQMLPGLSIELALGFLPHFADKGFIRSFVNFRETRYHGTHIDAVLDGIAEAITSWNVATDPPLKDKKAIAASLKQRVGLVVHVQLSQPDFRGATREKLGSEEIIAPIQKWIIEVFHARFTEDKSLATSLREYLSEYP